MMDVSGITGCKHARKMENRTNDIRKEDKRKRGQGGRVEAQESIVVTKLVCPLVFLVCAQFQHMFPRHVASSRATAQKYLWPQGGKSWSDRTDGCKKQFGSNLGGWSDRWERQLRWEAVNKRIQTSSIRGEGKRAGKSQARRASEDAMMNPG